jgi:hypothetical protein
MSETLQFTDTTLSYSSTATHDAGNQNVKATFAQDLVTLEGRNGAKVNLRNLADPVNGSDALTLDYYNQHKVSSWLEPVDMRTTAALPACTYANGTAGVGATLTGDANGALANQDGQTPTTAKSILVLNQAAGAQNGVYDITQVGDGSNPFILTRRADCDQAADFVNATVAVSQGTTHADTNWQCSNNSDMAVGTTSVAFASFGSGGGGGTPDDNSVNLAQLAHQTQGSLLTFNGSDPIVLGPGTTGQPLVSQGAGSNLAYGQLAAAGIANDAVTTDKILNDAVTSVKIVDNAVTAGKIANDAVTADKIATDAVTAVKIANDAVATAKIANSAVTLAKMAQQAAGQIIVGQAAGDDQSVAVSGDATLAANGALTIANDAIAEAKIANNAVTVNKIADNAVSLAKMAQQTSGQIIVGQAAGNDQSVAVSGDATLAANGALTIANDAITGAKLAHDLRHADFSHIGVSNHFIHFNSSDIQHTVPTGQSHDFIVNATEMFRVDGSGITYNGSLSSGSDPKFKDIKGAIVSVQQAWEGMDSIEGITWTWKEGFVFPANELGFGVSSKDLAKVVPLAVNYDAAVDGDRIIDAAIPSMNIQFNKANKAHIVDLEAKCVAQDSLIAALNARLSALEALPACACKCAGCGDCE